MPASFVLYAAASTPAKNMENCQDFVLVTELDDKTILAAIADGGGNRKSNLQASILAATRMSINLKRYFDKDKDLVMENSRLFMEQAFLSANDILNAFKSGNEDAYGDFSTTLTAVLLSEDGTATFAHAGNTRLYYLRNLGQDGSAYQLSRDHTLGWEMVENGTISEEEYYMTPERTVLNNGLGQYANPSVQTFEFKINPNDVLLLTSDGVHYSIRPEGFSQIIGDERVKNLDDVPRVINEVAAEEGAVTDDMCTCVIWYKGTAWYTGEEDKDA